MLMSGIPICHRAKAPIHPCSQSSMFLVSPSKCFPISAEQAADSWHTHTSGVDVGYNATAHLSKEMRPYKRYMTSHPKYTVVSTFHTLESFAVYFCHAPSDLPLFARIFGQFSFPMPISLFKPRSQHTSHTPCQYFSTLYIRNEILNWEYLAGGSQDAVSRNLLSVSHLISA